MKPRCVCCVLLQAELEKCKTKVCVLCVAASRPGECKTKMCVLCVAASRPGEM